MNTNTSRMNVVFDAFPDSFTEASDFNAEGGNGEPLDMDVTLWPKEKDEIRRNSMVHNRLPERMALEAKGLTHQATQPVSPDSVVLRMGNRIAGTERGVFGRFQKIHTMYQRAGKPPALGEHAVKALVAPQRAFASHLPFVANRQLLTTARPAA